MDMTTFFAYARRAPFGGRLLQSQIDGMNAIIDQWKYYNLWDRRQLAYDLATAFHETGGRMTAIRETFAATDDKAIAILEKAWKAGRLPSVRTPYWRKDEDGKSWLGRGLVQLTHRRNYKTMGDAIGVDLVGNPSKALDLVASSKILVYGMAAGLFTGKKLDDYFNASKDDAVGARAIVNGKDKAKLIAGYQKNFLDALDAAYEAHRENQRPADVAAEDAKADNVPVSKSKSMWAVVGGLFGSAGLGVAKDAANSGATLLGAISNPWAFASLISILVAAGILTWLLASGRIIINRTKAK